MRIPASIPDASSTTFTMGTGKNRPSVMTIFSATAMESARFMYPVRGLK